MELSTFKEKMGEFITFLDVEKNVSENTLRAYESDLQQLATFWETISSKEKNVPHSFDKIMQRYALALFYKKISKPSLARKLSSMRSFIAYLKTQGVPVTFTFKSPRLDKKLPTTLSVDEIFYLLDSVDIKELPTKYPYRDKAIFELIYATGVRCSELINIKLLDINHHEQTIRIMGKGRRERMVLFGNKAQQAVQQYIEEERPAMLHNQKHDFLFVNCKGTPITSRSIQRIFEMFRKFLKIDRKLTPHKIRHSFATHLLNEGVNLRVIQELLGHKTIATTEIYTHISNQKLAQLCDEKHPLNELDHLVHEE
ncbi:tyrosine-type recombinase/integrase [Candidatus Babeliales bacterium]|nr:tyrosine-type recombinase/integrase [Candidatus Babeliales bacterium]